MRSRDWWLVISISVSPKKTYPDTVEGIDGLASGQFHAPVEEQRVLEVLRRVLGRLTEQPLELVPGPLQRMLDRVGEVLQGAYGDALLRRVLGRAVRFCQERYHYLKVYQIFFTKSSRYM